MKKQGGFGLVEVIIGLSILAISFFSLVLVGRNVTKLTVSTTRSLQADFLLEEGIEATRSIRDRGWSASLSALSGTSSLTFATSPSRWMVTTTPEIIDDIFYRTIAVYPVSRDFNDDIVLAGGTPDPNTKKITTVVSWNTGQATSSISASTYLTNYFND
ncbi:MAG TPA: prepilin-type N-terminal cleavage/methylation domain-containing protein [Candidatus Paceibacterota bacterium]